jgi:succinyl-diaminopimelate desuccinylase
MMQELRSRIGARHREMLDFARVLISIPTENPPGSAYETCARLLRAKLRELGLALETRIPGRCVQAHYGRGPRTLYFHGHYDVVPASESAQFRPVMKGGKLFGRGSSDMKSGLAAMIYAVRALADCGAELDGKIRLTLVPDEETGGAHGSDALLRSGALGLDGIGMLTPEPTGGVIWNSSRGAVSLRVTVNGKAAHVSAQHVGRNAFEAMVAVAERLLKLKAQIESSTTRFPVRPAAARRSVLLLGGRCEGGASFNMVPARCSFTIDRRTNPEEDVIAEKARLMRCLRHATRDGVALQVDVLQQAGPSRTPRDSRLARMLAASVREVTGRAPRFEMCPGLLETRFYAQSGIPALAYGPGLLAVSHGPREFAPVQNISDCALIYALTAARMLAKGQP